MSVFCCFTEGTRSGAQHHAGIGEDDDPPEDADGDHDGGDACRQTCRCAVHPHDRHTGARSFARHQSHRGVPGGFRYIRQVWAAVMEALPVSDPLSSSTGNAGKREEMQELPRHAHQAGIPQLALAGYLEERESPGAGPARK